MLDIKLLVDEDHNLTPRGWKGVESIALAMDTKLSRDAQWASLFSFAESKLEGDEDLILYFLAIARKIYLGEISPRSTIEVEL